MRRTKLEFRCGEGYRCFAIGTCDPETSARKERNVYAAIIIIPPGRAIIIKHIIAPVSVHCCCLSIGIQRLDIDCAICTENIWLELTHLGLGGLMLGIAPVEERMRAVEEVVGIPEGLRAFAIFPLGYPAESRKQQDRFDESRIHFV